MSLPVVPLLLLVVAPTLYFASRLGWTTNRLVRAGGGAALALLVLWNLPYDGLDFAILKRMNLFVAAAVIVVLRSRESLGRRRLLGALGVIAAFAGVVYVNFFSFHGARTFVHLHDVAHYYLGSKYSPELGYGRLYTAMLRAEAELYDNHFRGIETRDLTNDRVVHVRVLLERSEPVKAAFSPERWRDFQTDLRFFHDAMGVQYASVIKDHGYNATPFWTWIGGFLANLVPAGSETGIRLLTFVDPLLLAAAFALVGAVFGVETLLYSLTYFFIIFGATFGWTGGAFLRHGWFAALLAAACAVERERGAAAGALLAMASLLAVFPALLVTGLIFRAAWSWLGRGLPLTQALSSKGREENSGSGHGEARLLVSFGVTGALLFVATLLQPHGLDDWRDFYANLSRHMQGAAYNTVGFASLLDHERIALADSPLPPETFQPGAARTLGVTAAVAVALLLVGFRSRRSGALEAVALGILPIFAALKLASYYYVVLALLVPAYRQSTEKIGLLFWIELATYALLLFEESETVLFFYRNVLIGLLLFALNVETIAEIGRAFVARPAETAA